MARVLDLPLTESEVAAFEPHMPLVNAVMDNLDEQERRLRAERIELQEALDKLSGRRTVPVGDNDPRKSVWDQEDSRQRKAGLYKLYLQNAPLGEIVDKIAKRFISGNWSIVPRPTLPGVKNKRKGKKGELMILLDFFFNTNGDEDYKQLLYKFALDIMIYGESYFEIEWWQNKPLNIYSLPTAYMDFVADKFNVVKYYTFAKPSDTLASKPKRIDTKYIFRVWVPELNNPLRAFSVIEGMVNPLFNDQMMIKTQQSSFQNLSSSAQVLYEMGPSSSMPMAKQLQVWLRENYSGVQNAGNERILFGGAKASVLNLRPLDSEFLKGREVNKEEIHGRMHVPVDFKDETAERNFRFDVLDFLIGMWCEKVNFGIIQQGFKITDWVQQIYPADYAADPYSERVKTLGEKRKEQQLEGKTPFDDYPLIVLETHAQDQKQRVGIASRTPGSDGPVPRSKRLTRTSPGQGKDKQGTSKPPAPPKGDS